MTKRTPKVFNLEEDGFFDRRGKGRTYRGRVCRMPNMRGGGKPTLTRGNGHGLFRGVSDEDLDDMLKGAVRLSIEVSRNAGKPVAKYDLEKRKAYKEYPDGRRVYE